MERTWAAMQRLTRDELVAEYDREAKTVGVWGLDFIRQEIFQRDVAAQGDRMERMTTEVRNLTRWIAGLTALIAVLTVILVCAERR